MFVHSLVMDGCRRVESTANLLEVVTSLVCFTMF